jgi:hypothetical protein
MFRKILRKSTTLAGVAVIMSVAACATSQVLISKGRAPISPDQVQLYLEPPAKKYQEIATVDTSSKHSLSFTAEGKTDVVIRRLKEAAAKLGANGIVLQDVADVAVGSVGTAVGTDFTGAHGTLSLGVIGSGLMSQKFGRGTAIYLQ